MRREHVEVSDPTANRRFKAVGSSCVAARQLDRQLSGSPPRYAAQAVCGGVIRHKLSRCEGTVA